MQCPSQNALEDYASELGTGDTQSQTETKQAFQHEIAGHLEGCEHCRSIVQDISSGDRLLDQLREAVQGAAAAQTGTKTELLVGGTIAGYALQSKIYSGGQAEVFRATRQDAPESKFAVKVWRQRLSTHGEHRIRFERELAAIQSFDHPAIVKSVAGGIENEVGYLVMPLIDGLPIDQHCASKGKTADARETAELLLKVLEGVAYAHRRGIFHRDLKPANILVTHDGAPKVLDFGLAKPLDGPHAPAASSDSEDTPVDAPTQSGQFLGTLAFAAPEQTLGNPSGVDARCDVYSLGVTAYLMLTGRMPYRTSGPIAEILSNIRHAAIAAPSKWNPGLDADLDAILLKALEREPRDRYQTVEAFRADVNNYLRGDIIEARRNSHWHLLAKAARKNRWAVAAASLLLCSLIAVSVLGGLALVQTRKSLELTEENLEREKELAQAALAAQEQAESRAYMASITAATLAGNPRSAREWLDAAPEPLRRWEWHYLKRISDQTGSLLEGHDRYVESVRHVNEEQVLSTGWDGDLKLWDVIENREIMSLHLDKHVWGLAVHPNAKLAAVGDFDGRVHLVDLDKQEVSHVIQGPDAPVFGCAFSRDGKELACTFSKSKQSLVPPLESTVCVFDTEDWTQLQAVDLETSTRVVVPFSAGQWLVSGLSKGAIVSTQEGLLDSLPASTSLTYSEKTAFAYLAEFGSSLKAYDTQRGFEEPVWTFDGGVINELAIDDSGMRLALASRQSTIRTMDARTGVVLHERVGHDWAVSTCDFLSTDTLVSGGWDKTVRTWKLDPGGSAFQEWRGHQGPIHLLRCNREWLWSGSQDGTLRVWDRATGETVQIVEFDAPVWCIALSPEDNQACCIGLGNGQMVRADVEAGRIRQRERFQLAKEGGVHDIVFTDPDVVVACTANNLLVKFDLKENKVVGEDRSHRGHIHRVLGKGDRLFTADHDVIRIWRKQPLKLLDEIKRSIYRDDFTLEVVGNSVIAGRNPGQIGIWEFDSEGKAGRVETLNGHGDEVLDLAIHPDQTRMVSCAADGSTKIWNLESRKLLSVIHSGSAELCRVEFDSAGKVLFGGTTDGRILVWNEQGN